MKNPLSLIVALALISIFSFGNFAFAEGGTEMGGGGISYIGVQQLLLERACQNSFDLVEDVNVCYEVSNSYFSKMPKKVCVEKICIAVDPKKQKEGASEIILKIDGVYKQFSAKFNFVRDWEEDVLEGEYRYSTQFYRDEYTKGCVKKNGGRDCEEYFSSDIDLSFRVSKNSSSKSGYVFSEMSVRSLFYGFNAATEQSPMVKFEYWKEIQ